MIRLEAVAKVYGQGQDSVLALTDLTLHIRAGESVAVVGPSGSGKSTLLNVTGLLTKPSSGEVWLDDTATSGLPLNQRAQLRNRMIGFVFQHYGLLPELTVGENVDLPLIYGAQRGGRGRRVRNALEAVGMAGYAKRYPGQLSGGQQQRVALARALVTEAPIILADEPTGALDSQTGQEILNLLLQLSRQGRTLVIVTHNLAVAAQCQRVVRVSDGRMMTEMDVS